MQLVRKHKYHPIFHWKHSQHNIAPPPTGSEGPEGDTWNCRWYQILNAHAARFVPIYSRSWQCQHRVVFPFLQSSQLLIPKRTVFSTQTPERQRQYPITWLTTTSHNYTKFPSCINTIATFLRHSVSGKTNTEYIAEMARLFTFACSLDPYFCIILNIEK